MEEGTKQCRKFEKTLEEMELKISLKPRAGHFFTNKGKEARVDRSNVRSHCVGGSLFGTLCAFSHPVRPTTL